MRCLVTARVDTEVGNRLLSSGKMGPLLQQALADVNPEAIYFAPSHGQRTMYLIADLADASDVVTKLEPLWLGAKADLEGAPVMAREGLERGMQALGPNLAKYSE